MQRLLEERVIDRFLKCGDPHHGFARIYCPECRHDYLLPFSCKARYFCPSCHQKRVLADGDWVEANVLAPVPHRQYVFTVPRMSRPIFSRRRGLLGELCHIVERLLIQAYVGAGVQGRPGLILFVQTFGALVTFNPHIHVLAADGLFRTDGAFVATGYKPAVLVDGDASVMMHLAEFETAVRYGMPLLVVVMNNEALGAEYYKLDAHQMDVKPSMITTPDLGGVGVAMGGRGRLALTIDELRAGVAEFVAKPGPTMIDLRISRTVPSVPYRRIHYGRDE